jgi:hypothetical protein
MFHPIAFLTDVEMRHREYFENRTDKNLLDRVRSEMSGPLQRLCIRLLNGPRGGDDNFDADAVGE